jgi:hypothetical protein
MTGIGRGGFAAHVANPLPGCRVVSYNQESALRMWRNWQTR